MLNRKSLRDGERGQVLLLFVAFFTILIVFAAITIDQGLWLGHRRVAQKDADAAARAGAAQYLTALQAGLPPTTGDYNAAGAAALDLASRNGAPTVTAAVAFSPSGCANTANTAQTCARPDCPTIDPSSPGQAGTPVAGAPSIEIAVPRPAPALFLRAFGVGDADIGARSTACVGSPTEILPGPIDALPLMVHYDDAADPTNPAPCFDGLIPRIGQQCIIDTRLTALLYPPAPGFCEGPNVSVSTIDAYLVGGLNGTDYVCTINPCADTYSGGLCPTGSCTRTPPYATDCLSQKTGSLGHNDIDALSQRLINGETGTGKCWLRTQGSNALAAFKTAFARADGEPVGGPPGIGGTDAPGMLYVKRQCDTGRLVLVFVTEITHSTAADNNYPVLAFALVYLTSCQGPSDPTPAPGTLNWCDNVHGFGNVVLRGVPLRLIFTGSIGGDIRPPQPGQPLVIYTTR